MLNILSLLLKPRLHWLVPTFCDDSDMAICRWHWSGHFAIW